jgi:GH24 family phage-related lysozyme (muramidase)
MDPDDLKLLDQYLQAGIALRNQPLLPTDADLAALAQQPSAGAPGGASQTLPPAASPSPAPPQAAQPLTGLYALGMAPQSGDLASNPPGLYDDNAPDYSASAAPAANPNLVLAANRPPPPGSAGPYGSNIPPDPWSPPTGYGAGPASTPNPPPVRPFSAPGPMWSPPTQTLPSAQDQSAARAQLNQLGAPISASSTNPYVDGLQNTAQGRAVPWWDDPIHFGGLLGNSNADGAQELEKLRQTLSDPTVEGYRRDVYLDSQGNPTVGIGHKVLPSDHLKVGDIITDGQVEDVFRKDASSALAAAHQQANQAGIDDPSFISALASVNFQDGPYWRGTFPKTWSYIMSGQYEDAARELGNDKWARETPSRVAAFQAALRALPPRRKW